MLFCFTNNSLQNTSSKFTSILPLQATNIKLVPLTLTYFDSATYVNCTLKFIYQFVFIFMGWTGVDFFRAGICPVYFFFPVFQAEFGGLKNQSLIHKTSLLRLDLALQQTSSAHMQQFTVSDSIIFGQSLTQIYHQTRVVKHNMRLLQVLTMITIGSRQLHNKRALCQAIVSVLQKNQRGCDNYCQLQVF